MQGKEDQGIITNAVSSRQGSKEDSQVVKEELHYGVRLLISNSKMDGRVNARKLFEGLLISQAGMYLANDFEQVQVLGREINNFLLEDEKKATAENLEIDMYADGWVEGPLVPVKEEHTEIMGVQADVIPLHMSTPLHMSVRRSQKMTPSAKGDSNVVNVGEAAGTSDDCLLKKVAQLERALTYARYQAREQDIEEVVGYGAVFMSMVYGSSLASAMIDLHADIFPYLALLATMKKKGGLAYLLSSWTVVDDVQKVMEHYGSLMERFGRIEQDLNRTWWAGVLSLGMAIGLLGLSAFLASRR